MSEWKETEFGIIPGSWSTSNLANISEFITDGSHFSPKPYQSEYLMASVKDMRYNYFDFSECKTIAKSDFDQLVQSKCSPRYGDILVSKDGANCLDLIFVYRQRKQIVILSSIAMIRLKQDFDSDFYRYFLLSPQCQYIMRNNFVSGSAIPRIVLKNLEKVLIPLLEINEQKAIATVLSSLDDKIDLLHRQNKTLEAMAETLFRQWFVEPAHRGGEADESWEEVELKELVFHIKPGTNSQPKRVEKGISFLNVRNLNNGFVKHDDTTKVDINEYYKIHKNWQPEENDVLISRIGTLGIVAVLTKEDLPLVIHYNMLNLKPKLVSYQFLFFLLKSSFFQEKYFANARQSVQEYLAIEDVEAIKIYLPLSDPSFRNKEKILNELFDKKYANHKKIQTLEKLRDTLLPKLMSGEVRVLH